MNAATIATLTRENVSVLRQLSLYLSTLSDADYTRTFSHHGSQTIGRHVRHITGHYACLLRAMAEAETDTVDFAARERSRVVEESLAAGLSTLDQNIRDLDSLMLGASDQPLKQRVAVPGDEQATILVASSVARELVFLSSHTIHHLAIVKLLGEQAGFTAPAEFGVHPSTLRHQANNPATPDVAVDAPPAAYGSQPIDLLGALEEKNPALYQRLPGVVKWLLPKVTYQTEMNQALQALPSLPCREFPAQVLTHLDVRGHVTDHSVALPPEHRRPVFVANHPTGGFDGVVMMAWLLSHYSSIKVVVTDALLQIPHMAPFVVPVDRYRRARASTQALHTAFAGDEPLLVFPAGRTGRRRKGIIRDAAWHKMPVSLALQHQRTLVPVHIDGHNSRLFDAVAYIRRLMGLGLNLEMALLPREFMRPACKTFNLTAGDPISPQALRSMGDSDGERLHALRTCYERLAQSASNAAHEPEHNEGVTS